MSPMLTNPTAAMSTRTCPHCAAVMKRVEEHVISEQYTRETWWSCPECRRSRYFRA
jgi:uncharacterized protein with PIN domain